MYSLKSIMPSYGLNLEAMNQSGGLTLVMGVIKGEPISPLNKLFR